MIIVKEVENKKHTVQCSGCGEAHDAYTHIEGNDLTDAAQGIITLCPTCKATLMRELILTPNHDAFVSVKIIMERELLHMKADLKYIMKEWKDEFGSPLTTERVLEHRHHMKSIGYLNYTKAIKEIEQFLKIVSYGED